MKAKLIVIEGLDGSGKATQTQLLKQSLKDIGVNTNLISFPDYEHPSSTLVRLYLNGDISSNLSDVNAYAASSFYSVDRYISYIKYWKEIYESSDVIIADRYTTSNAVYQMTKLPSSDWDDYISWLQDYEYNKLGLPEPDLVLYLDMPTKLSQKLLNSRYCGNLQKKDIHESNLSFLQKCRSTASYLSEKLSWNVINCYLHDENSNIQLRSLDDIHTQIFKIVNTYIKF